MLCRAADLGSLQYCFQFLHSGVRLPWFWVTFEITVKVLEAGSGGRGAQLNELESSFSGEVSVGWRQWLPNSVWPEILLAGFTLKGFLVPRESSSPSIFWCFCSSSLYLLRSPLPANSVFSWFHFIQFCSFLKVRWARGMMATGTGKKSEKSEAISVLQLCFKGNNEILGGISWICFWLVFVEELRIKICFIRISCDLRGQPQFSLLSFSCQVQSYRTTSWDNIFSDDAKVYGIHLKRSESSTA